MNYEPNEETVLDMIIPKYMSSLDFGALRQAVASEKRRPYDSHGLATNNGAGRDAGQA